MPLPLQPPTTPPLRTLTVHQSCSHTHTHDVLAHPRVSTHDSCEHEGGDQCKHSLTDRMILIRYGTAVYSASTWLAHSFVCLAPRNLADDDPLWGLAFCLYYQSMTSAPTAALRRSHAHIIHERVSFFLLAYECCLMFSLWS